MDKVCYIVGAGNFDTKVIDIKEQDYVIAADGGYNHLEKLGIAPDILIGDFDSITEIPSNVEIVKHPKQKDETDMMLAVETGFEMGFNCFVIYGGLGGRLDHTMANIQTLNDISNKGSKAFLVGDGMVITAVTNGEIEVKGKEGVYISVFCIQDEAKGVYLKNLKYPLVNATITSKIPIGVSNEFTNNVAKIRVDNGTLIVMWYESDFIVDR